VKPLSSDICQLRLDFDNFDLTETVATNQCNVDTFGVTVGSGRVYHNLCGTLTGQHIYLETGRKTTNQELTFTIAAAGSTVATWRVKVVQVECFSTSKAPLDCYQYLTGVSGSLTSFNYPTALLELVKYTTCVRREAGYCGIQWSQTGFTSNLGTAASTVTPDPFSLDATETKGLALELSGGDAHLIIPGSLNTAYGGSVLVDEYTATAANVDIKSAAVKSSGVPFTLTYVALDLVMVDGTLPDSTGYSLQYNQIPC